MKFKLLTYNIAFGSGRNTGRPIKTVSSWFLPNPGNVETVTRIAEFIKEQKPDVACLQEVNEGTVKNKKVNQSGIIERVTGLKKVQSVKNTVIPGYIELSNVIFSNMKVRKKSALKLPVIIFNRDANMVSFGAGSKTLTVINAHLSTVAHAGISQVIKASRPWQIKRLTELVNNRESPVVLCGDLNSDETSDEYAALRRAGLNEFRTGKTYSSWNPSYRFDYVMATPEIKILKTKVLKTDYSDHLPVVSELIV